MWSNDNDFSIDVFNCGADLLSFIEKEYNFNIIFLDILMKDMDGIEVGLTIRDILQDELTKLIYISTSKDFVMDLFNVRITQFIVKPLLKEQVEKIFMKTLQIIEQESQLFTFKISSSTHIVPIGEIIYFESVGKKVKIVTVKDIMEFYGSLSCVIEKHYQNFIHIHRSYYVNFIHITAYNNKDVTMRNGAVINIGSERKNNVSAKLRDLTNRYLKGV